jgi:hypothetical protein
MIVGVFREIDHKIIINWSSWLDDVGIDTLERSGIDPIET